MRVETRGGSDPDIAVVGGIHGDEPCGVRAIERVLASDVSLQRPVKFVIANDRALAVEERYLDADLNRSFPGSYTAEAHEQQLAARLTAELQGMTMLSIHSTQSYAAPFAVVGDAEASVLDLVPELPIDAVVTSGAFLDGRLLEIGDVIEIEAGKQGSPEAVDNAEAVTWAFLYATDALSETVLFDRDSLLDPATAVRSGPHVLDENGSEVPMFQLSHAIRKQEARTYEVRAQNFTQVTDGDVYAVADDTRFVADQPFYPVLLSANGYERIFGYAAERIGTVD